MGEKADGKLAAMKRSGSGKNALLDPSHAVAYKKGLERTGASRSTNTLRKGEDFTVVRRSKPKQKNAQQ